jgi:hypothetical protein
VLEKGKKEGKKKKRKKERKKKKKKKKEERKRIKSTCVRAISRNNFCMSQIALLVCSCWPTGAFIHKSSRPFSALHQWRFSGSFLFPD